MVIDALLWVGYALICIVVCAWWMKALRADRRRLSDLDDRGRFGAAWRRRALRLGYLARLVIFPAVLIVSLLIRLRQPASTFRAVVLGAAIVVGVLSFASGYIHGIADEKGEPG